MPTLTYADVNYQAQNESAKQQMQFQERMSNTAHQREVADLKAAGLNPVLSAGGTGATTPTGALGYVGDTNAKKFDEQVAAYNLELEELEHRHALELLNAQTNAKLMLQQLQTINNMSSGSKGSKGSSGSGKKKDNNVKELGELLPVISSVLPLVSSVANLSAPNLSNHGKTSQNGLEFWHPDPSAKPLPDHSKSNASTVLDDILSFADPLLQYLPESYQNVIKNISGETVDALDKIYKQAISSKEIKPKASTTVNKKAAKTKSNYMVQTRKQASKDTKSKKNIAKLSYADRTGYSLLR